MVEIIRSQKEIGVKIRLPEKLEQLLRFWKEEVIQQPAYGRNGNNIPLDKLSEVRFFEPDGPILLDNNKLQGGKRL